MFGAQRFTGTSCRILKIQGFLLKGWRNKLTLHNYRLAEIGLVSLLEEVWYDNSHNPTS
ncbi:hypothetical protein KIM372_02710 [Bombiscardovia nodaiensis]|uniref:Transposase n=1 Tax=Bombiscardovia nodaiensis TaxID=2932181 RepID=A0ABM8B691_9BIFI|nr:hypothetical protein KIM372_02710 [Bombiscardovia nodaiensis]